MTTNTRTPGFRPEYLRAVPVEGDRVYYFGSLTDLHGFGTIDRVVASATGQPMVVIILDATLDRGTEVIRCRRASVEVVSTGHRCDNCGTNGDAYPFVAAGTEWAYCGPCRDAMNTRKGLI